MVSCGMARTNEVGWEVGWWAGEVKRRPVPRCSRAGAGRRELGLVWACWRLASAGVPVARREVVLRDAVRTSVAPLQRRLADREEWPPEPGRHARRLAPAGRRARRMVPPGVQKAGGDSAAGICLLRIGHLVSRRRCPRTGR
jgi:hypothetical protein